MNPYVIFTDSAADIPESMMKEWGVPFKQLTFTFNDSEKIYKNFDMSSEEFYNKMRAGGIAKTAAINVATFEEAFEEELKKGNDVLYLAFSSGLSTTYNSGRVAAEELSKRYPENKIIAVDTLCASAGGALIVYLALREKNAGKTIEEVAAYAENIRLNIAHWFTVDDLVYLKRGGRVSPTVAFVGNALGIKPVLHVDDDGHLINMTKVRGRKPSLKALVDKFGELHDEKEKTIFISHGDCQADAEYVAEQIKERYGFDDTTIVNIGPVIGAHAGPGTVALFFVTDKHR